MTENNKRQCMWHKSFDNQHPANIVRIKQLHIIQHNDMLQQYSSGVVVLVVVALVVVVAVIQQGLGLVVVL